MLGGQECPSAKFYRGESLQFHPHGYLRPAMVHEALQAGMAGYNLYSLVSMSPNGPERGRPVAVVRWGHMVPCFAHQDPTLLAVLGPATIHESPLDPERIKAVARGDEHLPHTAGLLFKDGRPVGLWLHEDVLWKEIPWQRVGDALNTMLDFAKELVCGKQPPM